MYNKFIIEKWLFKYIFCNNCLMFDMTTTFKCLFVCADVLIQLDWCYSRWPLTIFRIHCMEKSYLAMQKHRHQKMAIRRLSPSNSVQFSSVQFSSVQFSSVQFSSVQFSSVQFSSVQFSSVQFSSVQFSSVQFSSVQFNSIYLFQTYQTIMYICPYKH